MDDPRDSPPHPHRRRRHRRAPHAGARHRRGAPRARPRRRAGAGRRGARGRGPPAPDPGLPLSPAALGADLPPHLVEERPLAASSPGTCCARSAGCSPRSVPSRCSAPAATPPHPSSGGPTRHGIPTAVQEQNAYPGPRDAAPEPPGAARLPGPAGGALAAPLRRRRPACSTPATRSRRRRPSGARRRSARFGLDGARPVVLVTGGSQGALALNRAVAGWLDAGWPAGVDLLWVTGRGTHAEFAGRHRPPAVQVIDFLDPMADGYAVADVVVVSRAGMITVAELCAWGLPSVIVPLPTAAADHQTHNARVLAEAGASAMLLQAELTPARLAHGGGRPAHRSCPARRHGRARARPRPAPRRRRDSVKIVDARPEAPDFENSQQLLTLAHPS